MTIEKRCTCENDFVEFVMKSQVGFNPIIDASRQEMAHQAWQNLVEKEAHFYKRHGYIDIVYNNKTKKFLRKKIMGRPTAIKRKENRITVRLDNELLSKLDQYCKNNNIEEKAEAIRIAIEEICRD